MALLTLPQWSKQCLRMPQRDRQWVSQAESARSESPSKCFQTNSFLNSLCWGSPMHHLVEVFFTKLREWRRMPDASTELTNLWAEGKILFANQPWAAHEAYGCMLTAMSSPIRRPQKLSNQLPVSLYESISVNLIDSNENSNCRVPLHDPIWSSKQKTIVDCETIRVT